MTDFLRTILAGAGIIFAVLLGLLFLFVWSIPSSCQDLVNAGRHSDLPQRLELWANENVFSRSLSTDDIRRVRYRLGGYWEFVGAPFPWESIGFSTDGDYSKVRIVGRGRNWVEQGDLNDYPAVGLSDRSYEGYLIKKKDAPGFGITPKFDDEMYLLSENVAVLCIRK